MSAVWSAEGVYAQIWFVPIVFPSSGSQRRIAGSEKSVMVRGISTDPIADMLTIVRNGYLAGKKEVTVSLSKTKKHLAEILKEEGFIAGVKVTEQALVIKLAYDGKDPALTGVKRLSKPGLRVYAKRERLPAFRKGLGIVIVSTSKGLMTDADCKKQKLGGELVCRVW